MAWMDAGYRIAAQVDNNGLPFPIFDASLIDPLRGASFSIRRPYAGFSESVNWLTKQILANYPPNYPDAQWIVSAGDDTLPDPRPPLEIAEELSDHFGGTMGVMQPTGDGHGIETICGSPWMGREFCERINGGRGPFWPEYTHMFADQEMKEVAERLGVLWQRPDLTHKHNHWSWSGGQMPTFLAEQNSPAHWNKYLRLFEDRRHSGFPGSEPR